MLTSGIAIKIFIVAMIKLLSVVTLCLWLGAVNSKKGDVSISLSARWEGTPYVAEVAEALVSERFDELSS